MPTGYTASLENKNYNVKQWMKEDVARAFGVCIIMRDDGKLSEEEMREKLIEGFDISYHEERIETAKLLLTKLQQPNYDFEGELAKMKEKAQKRYDESLKEFNTKREAHIKAMGEVDVLASKVNVSHSELITNAVNFARTQLKEAFDFDYGHGPYKDSILDVKPEEWKEAQLEMAKKDIDYHTEKLAEQKKANEERLAMYDEYIGFINNNL